MLGHLEEVLGGGREKVHVLGEGGRELNECGSLQVTNTCTFTTCMHCTHVHVNVHVLYMCVMLASL